MKFSWFVTICFLDLGVAELLLDVEICFPSTGIFKNYYPTDTVDDDKSLVFNVSVNQMISRPIIAFLCQNGNPITDELFLYNFLQQVDTFSIHSVDAFNSTEEFPWVAEKLILCQHAVESYDLYDIERFDLRAQDVVARCSDPSEKSIAVRNIPIHKNMLIAQGLYHTVAGSTDGITRDILQRQFEFVINISEHGLISKRTHPVSVTLMTAHLRWMNPPLSVHVNEPFSLSLEIVDDFHQRIQTGLNSALIVEITISYSEKNFNFEINYEDFLINSSVLIESNETRTSYTNYDTVLHKHAKNGIAEFSDLRVLNTTQYIVLNATLIVPKSNIRQPDDYRDHIFFCRVSVKDTEGQVIAWSFRGQRCGEQYRSRAVAFSLPIYILSQEAVTLHLVQTNDLQPYSVDVYAVANVEILWFAVEALDADNRRVLSGPDSNLSIVTNTEPSVCLLDNKFQLQNGFGHFSGSICEIVNQVSLHFTTTTHIKQLNLTTAPSAEFSVSDTIYLVKYTNFEDSIGIEADPNPPSAAFSDFAADDINSGIYTDQLPYLLGRYFSPENTIQFEKDLSMCWNFCVLRSETTKPGKKLQVKHLNINLNEAAEKNLEQIYATIKEMRYNYGTNMNGLIGLGWPYGVLLNSVSVLINYFNIPTVAIRESNAAFIESVYYSSVFLLNSNEIATARNFAIFLKRRYWTKIVVILEITVDLSVTYRNKFIDYGIEIMLEVLLRIEDWNEIPSSTYDQLNKVKYSGTNIIVSFVASDMKYLLFGLAIECGVAPANGYQWVAVGDAATRFPWFVDEPACKQAGDCTQAMLGMVLFFDAYNLNNYFTSSWFHLIQKWFASLRALNYGVPSVRSIMEMGQIALGYDAVFVFAYALNEIIKKNITVTGARIQQEIEKLHFSGVTGDINFHETEGRESYLAVVQLVDDRNVSHIHNAYTAYKWIISSRKLWYPIENSTDHLDYNITSDGYNITSDGYNVTSDGYNITTSENITDVTDDDYTITSGGYDITSDGYNITSDGYDITSDGYNITTSENITDVTDDDYSTTSDTVDVTNYDYYADYDSNITSESYEFKVQKRYKGTVTYYITSVDNIINESTTSIGYLEVKNDNLLNNINMSDKHNNPAKKTKRNSWLMYSEPDLMLGTLENVQLEIPYTYLGIPGQESIENISIRIIRYYLSVSGITYGELLTSRALSNGSRWILLTEIVPAAYSCSDGCGGGRKHVWDTHDYENGECTKNYNCRCKLLKDIYPNVELSKGKIRAYAGDTCLMPHCDKCRRGVCDKPDTCKCLEGWGGFDCSSAICEVRCVHGKCVAPNFCECRDGYHGAQCNILLGVIIATLTITALVFALVTFFCVRWLKRRRVHQHMLENLDWLVEWHEVHELMSQDTSLATGHAGPAGYKKSSLAAKSTSESFHTSLGRYFKKPVQPSVALTALTGRTAAGIGSFRKHVENVVIWRSITCYADRFTRSSLDVNSVDVRLQVIAVKELNHPNIVQFIGACLIHPNVAILIEYAPKGSLDEVLTNEAYFLTWDFKYSFLKDICSGMEYLHDSSIGSHGRLKSSNCLIDNRWTCKITGFGLPLFRTLEMSLDEATEVSVSKDDTLRSMLWTAPEYLRFCDNLSDVGAGSKAGDMYSFGIILSEICTRQKPFQLEMTILTLKELLRLLTEPKNPLNMGVKRILEMHHYNVTTYLRPSLQKAQLPEIHTEKRALEALVLNTTDEDPTSRPSFKDVGQTLNTIKPTQGELIEQLIFMFEKQTTHLEDIVTQKLKEVQDERQKIKELLNQLLPPAIIEEMKLKDDKFAALHENVSFFFSDLVDFDILVNEMEAFAVIEMLNQLSVCFDVVLQNFDVYTVNTLGNTYCITSGLPEFNKAHAEELAKMALNILSAVATFPVTDAPYISLKIRIGMHSGSCVAGAVGDVVPRYNVVGTDLFVAHEIQRKSKANRILVSNDMAIHLLKAEIFNLSLRGFIKIKRVGAMETYWLTGMRDFNKILPRFREIDENDEESDQ